MDSLNTGNLNISNLKNHLPRRCNPGSAKLLQLFSQREISDVRDA
jgi:hypothetical protein